MKRWIERFPRLALTLLALLCLIPGTWVLPLMDRDEPRFSRATVEMNERGNWVVPYFNNEYRFDKPPLTYWCMKAGVAVFGKSEMGVRLHSVIASWLIALVLFQMAAGLGAGNARAFMAGASWLTCLQVLLHGRLAVADMLLILWLVTTMFCLLEIGRRGGRWISMDRWFLGLVASLALGFLAKGPLIFAVPGLALGLAWLVARRSGQTAPLAAAAANLGVALVPAMALVSLWGIPALIETHGAYFDVGIGKHVVERGTVAFNERKSIPGLYYLGVMIPFLLPWTPLIPRTLRDAWRSLSWEKSLMLGWFAAPFLIFSLYSTQLPHYILPGYPALMLLIALTADGPVETAGWRGKTWRALSVWLPLGFGMLVVAAGQLAKARGCDASISLAVTCAGLFLLLLGLAAREVFHGRNHRALACAVAACLVFWPTGEMARRAHLTVRLHQAVGDSGPGVLRSLDFQEPSLVWYFQHPWEFSPGKESAALTLVQTRRWRFDGESFMALLKGQPIAPVDDDTISALRKLPPGDGPPRFVQGWNPGTSSWLELAYVRRSGD
jgi:4-amino-4-deoxy-L-arabinose transferase-like glycosyltransferase